MEQFRLSNKYQRILWSGLDNFSHPLNKGIPLSQDIPHGLVDLFRIGVRLQFKPDVPSSGFVYDVPKNIGH